MNKTIICEECKKSYTYDENPKYPRKYCSDCSYKKKQQFAAPKVTTAIPANVTYTPSKDKLIVRQCCLKCAVESRGESTAMESLLKVAKEFEDWVWR